MSELLTDSLTETELDILRLLGKGLNNDEIAELRGKHRQTVRNQTQKAMAKLGAKTKTQAVVIALVGGKIE